MVKKMWIKKDEEENGQSKIVDWTFKKPTETTVKEFEEVSVTEELIKELINSMTPENLKFLGYYKTRKEAQLLIKSLNEDMNKFSIPGFYVFDNDRIIFLILKREC